MTLWDLAPAGNCDVTVIGFDVDVLTQPPDGSHGTRPQTFKDVGPRLSGPPTFTSDCFLLHSAYSNERPDSILFVIVPLFLLLNINSRHSASKNPLPSRNSGSQAYE